MHAKVIPDWKPSSAPSGRTYRVDSLYADEEEDEEADIVEEQHERLPQQNTVEIYDKNPETQPHA